MINHEDAQDRQEILSLLQGPHRAGSGEGQRFRKVTAGYGGFPRPKPEGREKPTKRINLRYRCTQCKKANVSPCIRAKKFELTE